MASFMAITSIGHSVSGITVEYKEARQSSFGYEIHACVDVRLHGVDAHLSLSIEDAQALLEALPSVLAQHDYAEFLTAVAPAVAS